jgi:hypothetical protein
VGFLAGRCQAEGGNARTMARRDDDTDLPAQGLRRFAKPGIPQQGDPPRSPEHAADAREDGRPLSQSGADTATSSFAERPP